MRVAAFDMIDGVQQDIDLKMYIEYPCVKNIIGKYKFDDIKEMQMHPEMLGIANFV